MANDFLPFALDPRANVTHPQNWVDDPARARGFSAGPARSSKVNLLFRQSAFINAALTRYIAESIGEDVLDNGNLDGFVDQWIRALGTRRQILTNNLDLYVSTTGSDSNTGTQDRPFLTLQAAANYACHKLDIGPRTVNIHVAEGAYSGGVYLEGDITPDPNRLNFIGDASDPSRVVIAPTAGTGACFQAGSGASFTVNGFTVQNTTAGGMGLAANQYGAVWAYNMHFGECAKAHVEVWYGIVSIFNDLRIIGNSPIFLSCYGGQIQIARGQIIFLGNPVIGAFVEAAQIGYVFFRPTHIAGLPADGTVPVRVSENSIVNASLPIPGTEPVVVSSGGTYLGTGVIDSSNATPGMIGEYLAQEFGSPGTIMTPGITSQIGSMWIPAGDWDLTAAFAGNEPSNAAAVAFLSAKLSTVSLDIENDILKTTKNVIQGCPIFTIGGAWSGIDPNLGAIVQCQMHGRVSTTGTMVFLNAIHGNDDGRTILGYGGIYARRTR